MSAVMWVRGVFIRKPMPNRAQNTTTIVQYAMSEEEELNILSFNGTKKAVGTKEGVIGYLRKKDVERKMECSRRGNLSSSHAGKLVV